MLIKSTEMGVYIKWALLLQEELQRSLTLHSQLQQMRGKLESENSELSMALGRPDPRPAASAEVASRGSSTPSALPSVAELQRLAGASGGGVFGQTPGTGGCMCSGIRHASPQVAPPTGKRNHAAMVASAWQASERPSTSAPSRGYPAAQLNNASLCAASPDKQPPPPPLDPCPPLPPSTPLAPLTPPAALRRPSFGAGIPMSHELSLSDFDLPTPDELDGAAAAARCGGGPSVSTPGSARLNIEEERLLESLLSSPGMNPDLLHTPNLSKLTTQMTPRCAAGAWGMSERCSASVAAGGQLEPAGARR
jgi:hypothetical protein